MTTALLLALALVFVALAGFLAAAEAAFSFLPRHEAEERVAQGRAESLALILEDPVPHVHALRFWRIWFETAAAVAVAVLAHSWLANVWLAGLAATFVMALIGFLLVGVSPRQLGRQHAVPIAAAAAPLVRALRVILGPIPGWLVQLGSAATGTDPHHEDAAYTSTELREFVERSSDTEDLEDEQAELLQSVFELGETLVRAVMVPRTDIVAVESGATLRQAMSLFLRSGCSRVPVFRDSLDDVTGVLYLKDVAARLHEEPEAHEEAVDAVAREPRFVPESKPVDDLLKELQRESVHLAIVVDEYGGTAGLVTLEDLIEELVGEIVDEYDDDEAETLDLGDGRFRIAARMALDDLGELFDIDLEDDEVETAGGLLAKGLGRVPIVGSAAEVHGIRLTAERRLGRRNRISHLIAERVEDSTTTDHHDQAGSTHG
ncbi:membrane protein [Sinomonas cellulolyticus]|uniref:HlyC/CorC family transporter n=1 Tax=Sinomonas cellulolyticus TaxID=2801916 RepID=A0ABS1K0M4_9MICC|nr:MULTISPECIES: hemolysin family protein [Sinomonas]MBL0705224.1 HlyC/CorC family transporter [Sinomonas cellulolyticus]GHG39965.1 membrane protein [Sinomonas sp. KCTC 49339]